MATQGVKMARTYSSVTQTNNSNKQQIQTNEFSPGGVMSTTQFITDISDMMEEEEPQLPPALADVLKELVIPPIENYEPIQTVPQSYNVPSLIDSFGGTMNRTTNDLIPSNTVPETLLLADTLLPLLSNSPESINSPTKPTDEPALPVIHANQRILEIISSSSSSSPSSSNSSFSTSSSSSSKTSSSSSSASLIHINTPQPDPILLYPQEFPQAKPEPYQYLEQPFLELQYLDAQNLEPFLDPQSFPNELPQNQSYPELEQQLYEHPTLSIPETYAEPDSSLTAYGRSYPETETYQEPDSTFLEPDPPVLAYLEKQPELYFISENAAYLHPDFDPESYFEAHLNDPYMEPEELTPKPEMKIESSNYCPNPDPEEYEFEEPEHFDEMDKKQVVLEDIHLKNYSVEALINEHPDLVDKSIDKESEDDDKCMHGDILKPAFTEVPDGDGHDTEFEIDDVDSESDNESDSSISSVESEYQLKKLVEYEYPLIKNETCNKKPRKHQEDKSPSVIMYEEFEIKEVPLATSRSFKEFDNPSSFSQFFNNIYGQADLNKKKSDFSSDSDSDISSNSISPPASSILEGGGRVARSNANLIRNINPNHHPRPNYKSGNVVSSSLLQDFNIKSKLKRMLYKKKYCKRLRT